MKCLIVLALLIMVSCAPSATANSGYTVKTDHGVFEHEHCYVVGYADSLRCKGPKRTYSPTGWVWMEPK